MKARRPFSLTVRLISLLVAGLLALQVGVFAVTVHYRFEEQFRMAASDRARLAMTLYQLLASLPNGERADMVRRLTFESFRLDIVPQRPFAQNPSEQSLFLLKRLRELCDLTYAPESGAAEFLEPLLVTDVRHFSIDWRLTPMAGRSMLGPHPRVSLFDASAALPLENGTWLEITYFTMPALDGNLFGLLMELGTQFLLQILLAVAGIRYVTRPLRQLARFADRLAPGVPDALPPPGAPDGLPEHGPSEVLSASRAFRAMYGRIRHFVEERLRLLASLSHDLRTPIARLRLQLENEPALSRPERVFDALDDLQRMAEDAIAMARTGQNNEPERKTDVRALLESMVADYEEFGDAGGTECLEHSVCRVRLRAEAAPRCLLRPAAFRRCLENLVDNGLRYGHTVAIRLSQEDDEAVIRIEDDGPGIPENHREAVFQPFFRLEASRNTRTGGTGLGLSIARDLARLNHSDITLVNRPEGGLRATLRVPLAE